jgi:hypothetical protein
LTVEECIAASTSLVRKVFVGKSHKLKINGQPRSVFNTAASEQAVKEIVANKGYDEDALLQNHSSTDCKV